MHLVEIRCTPGGYWTVLVHGVEVYAGHNETFANVAYSVAKNTVDRLALLELMGMGATEYRHDCSEE